MLKIIVAIAFLWFCYTCCDAQTPLQSRQSLEKQRTDIEKEIEEVKQSLDAAHRNKRETLGQLALLERRLRLRESSIQNINAQIGLITRNMDESSRSIGDLRRELDTLKVRYAGSVVYAYKNRTGYGILSFIFSSGNFYDALRRMEYLNQYRASQEQQAVDIGRTQALLEGKVEGLKASREEKDAALQKQSKEKKILEQEKKEKDAVVVQLGMREKQLQRQIAVKQRKDRQLASAIGTAIRRARELAIREAKHKAALAAAEERSNRAATVRRQKEERAREDADARARAAAVKKVKPAGAGPAVAGTGRSPDKTGALDKAEPAGMVGTAAEDEPFNTEKDIRLTGSFEDNRKRLPWPVASRTVSMAFGKHRYMNTLEYDNLGITIETDAGTAVRVVFDGEVQAVLDLGDVRAVVVRHGKYFTTYSNLSEVTVSRGQQLKAGQVVGRVSEIGKLEFWLSDDKDHWLDPQKWLR